jgi:hypothetical protein
MRRKIRTQRRYGLPLENPLVFYPRWWFEASVAVIRWVALYLRYRRILVRVIKAPDAHRYTDPALQPTGAGEADRVVEAFADIIPHTHGAPPLEVKLTA